MDKMTNVLENSMENMRKIENGDFTYGAITPLTSGDLGKPHSLSHPSSSASNVWADEHKIIRISQFIVFGANSESSNCSLITDSIV